MTPLPIRNPRTGRPDYEITPPSVETLQETCRGLRAAQDRWHGESLAFRIETLQQWKHSIQAHRDAILDALVRDTGRYGESILEVDSVGNTIDRWCRLAPDLLALPDERKAAIPFVHIRQALRPYPLVGVISPWNFPFLLSVIDLIPALLAGCAAVVKPSEVTPRFIEPVAASLAAVPALREVMTYVAGGGETGAEIVGLVDLVCFTGSVATGRKVGEAAARHFIPAFLELGGKDAAIVLDSADIEAATSAILWGATVNAGQSCLSIERVYVHKAVHQTFLARLTAKAAAVSLAYPDPTSGPIGPLIFARQAEIIRTQLADAYATGARATCGGEVVELGGGNYCPPTVLTDVNHEMLVMTEETFGPIMPVMPFTDVEEAVALANDSTYGLSAAVFSGSEEEALTVAARLDAGAVSVNDACLTSLVHEGEKNAFKLSGLGGTRMGPAALSRFMRRQAYLIKRGTAPDPWWFDAR